MAPSPNGWDDLLQTAKDRPVVVDVDRAFDQLYARLVGGGNGEVKVEDIGVGIKEEDDDYKDDEEDQIGGAVSAHPSDDEEPSLGQDGYDDDEQFLEETAEGSVVDDEVAKDDNQEDIDGRPASQDEPYEDLDLGLGDDVASEEPVEAIVAVNLITSEDLGATDRSVRTKSDPDADANADPDLSDPRTPEPIAHSRSPSPGSQGGLQSSDDEPIFREPSMTSDDGSLYTPGDNKRDSEIKAVEGQGPYTPGAQDDRPSPGMEEGDNFEEQSGSSFVEARTMLWANPNRPNLPYHTLWHGPLPVNDLWERKVSLIELGNRRAMHGKRALNGQRKTKSYLFLRRNIPDSFT